MAETFRMLKELAAARDGQPDPVRSAYDLFASDGVLGKPRESARGKLGLPPLPEGGGEALARMLAAGQTPPGAAGCGDDELCVAAPAAASEEDR